MDRKTQREIKRLEERLEKAQQDLATIKEMKDQLELGLASPVIMSKRDKWTEVLVARLEQLDFDVHVYQYKIRKLKGGK